MQTISFLTKLIAIGICFDLEATAWLKAAPQPSGRNDALHEAKPHLSVLSLSSSHVVDGITCREVTINVEFVGPVTILEATADSQDSLVDMALAMDEDEGPNQLQSGDPYGAVLWPAASSISNYLLANCSKIMDSHEEDEMLPLSGLSILELGTGTGLVSLASSLGGASKIIATDYEKVPLKLLNYAQHNLNKGQTLIKTANLDLCDSKTPLPAADIVVAADIMYEPITGRAMAGRTLEALQRGSRVLIGDSPGRAGRPAFLKELSRLGIEGEFVSTIGQTCSGPRNDLICSKDSPTISAAPKDLEVAIMDLDPRCSLPK